MKVKVVLTVLFAVAMGLFMMGLAQADYSENFEGATVGQFLTAPPLSWESMVYSTESAKVAANQHGWTSKFATTAIGKTSYMKMAMSFATDGIIVLSFDAYLDASGHPTLAPSGSMVGFNTGGWAPRAYWSSWTNGWRFKPLGPTTVFEQFTIPHNTTVHFEISYDLTNQTTWGKAQYDSTTLDTLVYQLSDNGSVFDSSSIVMVTANADGEIGADIDNISVVTTGQPAPGTLTGHVVLQNFTNTLGTAVAVTIDLIQDDSIVRTENKILDANGNYTINTVDAGTYDVGIKAACWLRTIVQATVPPGSVGVADEAVLVNGDVDGDNDVTSSDVSVVLTNL